MTAGLVVVYFSSFRRIGVHIDHGGPGGLVVATCPHRLEAPGRNSVEKFAFGVATLEKTKRGKTRRVKLRIVLLGHGLEIYSLSIR